MKKKVIVWLVVLLFSVAGGFVAMFYGMEVVYRILSKIIGIALVTALLFAAMMVFLETYLVYKSLTDMEGAKCVCISTFLDGLK